MSRCVEGRSADWIASSIRVCSKQCSIEASSLAPSTLTCHRSDVPGVTTVAPGAVPQLTKTRGITNTPIQWRFILFLPYVQPDQSICSAHTSKSFPLPTLKDSMQEDR